MSNYSSAFGFSAWLDFVLSSPTEPSVTVAPASCSGTHIKRQDNGLIDSSKSYQSLACIVIASAVLLLIQMTPSP